MESKKPAASVTITLDLTDSNLALANVLIALHRRKVINLKEFLPVLDEVNHQTSYRTPEELVARSQTGLQLVDILRKVEGKWDERAPTIR